MKAHSAKGTFAVFAPTRRTVASLASDSAGASAVEFAIILFPFLVLVCSLMEAGVQIFSQGILQQAVDDASRQIYTGQFQSSNASTNDTATLINNFRKAICYPDGRARITTFNCANVRISLRRATDFTAATSTDATKTNAATGVSDWNPDFSAYSCAHANDIVVLQAAVDVPVFFPSYGSFYPTLPNNRRVIQAASVFKVEPYESSGACGSNS